MRQLLVQASIYRETTAMRACGLCSKTTDRGAADVQGLFNSLGQDGSNSLARAAPGSEAVEHDDLVLLDSLLELLSAVMREGASAWC